MIGSDGVYWAPAHLPSVATVEISAASHADPAKSASAAVTITSDLTVALTPGSASLELGAVQNFQASIGSSGHPDTAVRWTLSGAVCPSECGTVDTLGNFTAPPILPNNAMVTLTARSLADPSKEASAAVAITSNFSLALSAPVNVATGDSITVATMLTFLPGSNPSHLLSWSVTGGGCLGIACGVLSVITTQSSGGNPAASSASYKAPATAPSLNSVTITVTPQADPSKKAQITLAILQGVGV